MTERVSREPNRLQRRKARTRAALVSAAPNFIAQGKMNVPILEITQVADVGMGVVLQSLPNPGGALRRRGGGRPRSAGCDPRSAHRRTRRPGAHLRPKLPAHRTVAPQKSRAQQGPTQGRNEPCCFGKGLALRARRDIETATGLGRFQVGDADLAMALVTGAVLALGQLLHNHPPNVTTPQLPTRSLKTCCGDSVCPPRRLGRSAAAQRHGRLTSPTAHRLRLLAGLGADNGDAHPTMKAQVHE